MKHDSTRTLFSCRCTTIGLTLLTLAALAVRLLYLGRAELWGDEILFVIRDGYPGAAVADIYRHMLLGFSSVTHLPFPLIVHNLLLRFLTTFVLSGGLNGLSPFWFRFPAALWGTAAVPFTFLLLRNRLPRPVAWLATAWMAFGFFPVYYSREAYFYAPLIALSILTLHCWLRGIESLSATGRLPRAAMAGLLLASTATVHSHLTGMLFQGGLFIAAIIAAILPRRAPWRIPGAWRLAGISLIPLLCAAPFFHVWITQSVQSSMAPGTPLLVILRDVAGKFFLGHLPPLGAIGLALMLLGAWVLFRSGTPGNPAPRWMAGIGAGLFIALLIGAHSSSYLSRYFSSIAFLILTANACGIAWLSRRAARLPGLRRIAPSILFRSLGIAIIALNLLILPLFWLATCRARNYGAVSDWLTQNVPPGGAYLWESAYETRFVSEEPDAPYCTPERLAMRPIIHQGPEEIETLRSLQQDLLERYPEIPWIDSRHGHRPGMAYGDWEWPRTYFHHLVLLENSSFDLQERLRINIYPLGRIPLGEKSIPIWYNDLTDQPAIDFNAGRAASLFYPGWRFEATRGDGIIQEYARLHAGPAAPIQAVPLSNQETPVIFLARIAISDMDKTIPASLEFSGDSRTISRWELPPEPAFHDIQSPPFLLPPEGTTFTLQVQPKNPDTPTRIWLERAELLPAP